MGNIRSDSLRAKELKLMKSFLFLFSFILIAYKEIASNPSPNPDNDVHFHVNMPGSKKSYPLKTVVNENGADYSMDDEDDGWHHPVGFQQAAKVKRMGKDAKIYLTSLSLP